MHLCPVVHHADKLCICALLYIMQISCAAVPCCTSCRSVVQWCPVDHHVDQLCSGPLLYIMQISCAVVHYCIMHHADKLCSGALLYCTSCRSVVQWCTVALYIMYCRYVLGCRSCYLFLQDEHVTCLYKVCALSFMLL